MEAKSTTVTALSHLIQQHFTLHAVTLVLF
jgi:hypothetical protein